MWDWNYNEHCNAYSNWNIHFAWWNSGEVFLDCESLIKFVLHGEIQMKSGLHGKIQMKFVLYDEINMKWLCQSCKNRP